MSGALAGVVGGAPGAINQALQDGANVGSASIFFENDGDYVYGDGALGSATEDWVTPSDAGTAARYELQVNVTSGSIDIGTVDTWLSLATGREYSSAVNAVLRVRIREAGTALLRSDQEVQLIAS